LNFKSLFTHFNYFSVNIYVGNLNYRLEIESLEEAFSAYGEVSSAKLITDRETGRAKGFGFIEMPNDNEARAAIEALNGSEMMGRTLVVNEARPRA
jgi:RNA recognition motif-containing protein